MAEHRNLGVNIAFLLIAATVIIAGIIFTVMWMQTLPATGTPRASQPTSGATTAVAATNRTGFWAAFHEGARIRLTPTPAPAEEEETEAAESESSEAEASAAESAGSGSGEVDLDAAITAINSGGCIACHTIPGIPNAVGMVGPDLSNIGVDAATRIEGYSAEDYIRESLIEPNAFVAPDCPTGPCVEGVMVVAGVSDADLEIIIDYLLTLGVE